MSGSQHNPNGRQPQLGSGWSPLQVLQMANLLARAPQAHAHLASERGVTWHTPTPPPHLYHVPAPSPPDPLQGLQAMKGAGGNSVFRHTATPPELYRHTPTPPEKHLMRHTPSPGDVKGPPVDIYPHLGPGRDKLMRAEELLSYARQGSLDLSLGSRANGAAPHHPASPALSVRDAPTINSLIARAAPRRVDSILERLVPSPHSVIVHSRGAGTPSPPSSNEDSGDSCGAPPGSKRKRKPERTIRLPPAAPPPPPAPAPALAPTPTPTPAPASPTENGDAEHSGHSEPTERTEHTVTENIAHATLNGPEKPLTPPVKPASPKPVTPPRIDDESARRKTRSGSAETIADIAAMIAGGSVHPPEAPPAPPPLSVDKLQSVLGSPGAAPEPDEPEERTRLDVATGAAPRRRSARANSESSNVPVASPSEGRPAEPEPAPAPAGPAAASFVEVENQLEKMFAGLEEHNSNPPTDTTKDPAPASKRRKSAPGRGRTDTPSRRKGPRKKPDAKPRKHKELAKDSKEYDSGSNASSGKSRGPYIQIRGGASSGSPVSVCVMNAGSGEEEPRGVRGARGARGVRGGRGLHASTLGLRYDAATRDLSWLCAFCARPPHAAALGDLFGPYPVDTDCAEYRSLDEATRRLSPCRDGEAWVHAACGVWAPGVVAAGARVWGLSRAAWAACVSRCRHCARAGAALACAARACPARAHLPCAMEHAWSLDERLFKALCPAHKDAPPSCHPQVME